MNNFIKKNIKKIPLLGASAKMLYDWRQEKRLARRVKNLLKNGALDFANTAPPHYSIGYEPTIRCNLRCKMCYQGQTRAERREELDEAETIAVFKKLELKAEEIKLVGGEPLIRQDIFNLISFWDGAGKRVILQTNCALVDERAVDILKNKNNISDVLTSLDGPPEMHDAIRGVPGTFAKLEKAIGLIKEKMPRVKITAFATLLINDNLGNFEKLIDTCKKLGLDSLIVLFEQVYTSRDEKATRDILRNEFGWAEKDYRLNTQIREPLFPEGTNSKELEKRLSQIRDYGFKKGCYVNFSPFNYYKNLDKYLGEKPGRVLCLKLLSPELRIGQKGEVIWCDIIEKSFGSLLEKDPDQIWLSGDYQKFRAYLLKNSLPICSRCCKAIYL